MRLDSNQLAFFSLLRAGLWEQEVQLVPFGEIDYNVVYKLSEEQSITGLVTAGIEHVFDVKIPQNVALVFAGSALQIENANISMNKFLELFIDKLQKEGIYSLLLKGQGIAQCYERPLWRACGDIDLFLNNENYIKAKCYLDKLFSPNEDEIKSERHMSYSTGTWVVELHGTMRSCSLPQMDKVIDSVQDDTFKYGHVRTWRNGHTDIFLPAPNNDVIFVFTHYIKHFFHGGVGLRQICDWCRLLWVYRDTLDRGLLEHRLKRAKVLSEWKSFAVFAVNYLGMPVEAMPLYSNEKKWSRNADMILNFVLETGNFGKNRDKTYQIKYPFVVRKMVSLWKHSCDNIKYLFIFPIDSFIVWRSMLFRGIKAVLKR